MTRRSLFRKTIGMIGGAAVVRKAPSWWREYLAEDAAVAARMGVGQVINNAYATLLRTGYAPPKPSREQELKALAALNKLIDEWDTPASFRRTVQIVDPDGTRREVVINA